MISQGKRARARVEETGKERKESVLSITEVHFINDMLLHYCVIDNQDLQVDHSIR